MILQIEKENKTLTTYEENGSIYICKSKNLRKYNNRLTGKISLYKMDFWSSLQIDDMHDLELARWISNYKIKILTYQNLVI